MHLPGGRGRPTVYLHVGAMKTGTTYLQQLLYANRDELRAAGVLLPGETWSRQVRGVQDVMRMARRDAHVRRQAEGAWRALLDEALAAPRSTALISMEFLSFAGPRGVRRVLGTLEEFDVRVVLTVRDMAAAMPSQWQTSVHNGGQLAWSRYLERVPEPTVRRLRPAWLARRPQDRFHRVQNAARMVHTWSAALPPGSLHVVTVPRGRAELHELWHRFAGVVGVDPQHAAERPPRVNASLGYPSTELIRLTNRRLPRLSLSEYNRTVKDVVALQVLAKRADQESRARLTKPAYDLALRWNALVHEAVAATGAVVAGDLADLPVEVEESRRDALPDVPPTPDPAQVLDAAESAVDGLERLTRRRANRLSRAGAEPVLRARVAREELRARWEAAGDPLDAAAREVADRAREAALLLRRLREHRGAQPDDED